LPCQPLGRNAGESVFDVAAVWVSVSDAHDASMHPAGHRQPCPTCLWALVCSSLVRPGPHSPSPSTHGEKHLGSETA
jgi:hypothetical protein